MIYTEITLSNSMTCINDYTFYGCSDLIEVMIPDSVISIGISAFQSCDSLTKVTIPNSVTDIGRKAFFSCDSLVKVTIPNNVTNIGSEAFYDCRSLIEVTLPNGLTCIQHSTFEHCDNLTQVIIPSSVTHIDQGAFSRCNSLTRVMFSNDDICLLVLIDNNAFDCCSSLTDVYVSGSRGQYSYTILSGNKEFYQANWHFNAEWSKISEKHINCISLGKMNVYAGHFVIECPKDYSGTASWTSSDPTVFNLCGNTSKSFSGSTTQIEIYGDALALGKSIITIITSDGISCSFEIEVKNVVISGESIGLLPLDKKVAYAGYFSIKCPEDYSGTASWTSSEPTVFKLCGDTSKPFSGLTTQIDIYGDALAPGKSIITIVLDDGITCSFEIEVTENSCVMRLDRWDTEKQQVYFDSVGILNTYYVTDETELSESISSLVGEYVWVSLEDNSDGRSKNILAMHPVTSQLGILSDVTSSTIVVDDISYPISPALSTADLIVGKEVVFHIYNDQVVRVQYPYETTGTVTTWSYQDGLTIKTGNIVNTYITNSLTNKTFLGYIDEILDQDIKALVLDGVILRVKGQPKFLSKSPDLPGDENEIYLYANSSVEVPSLKDSYPAENRKDFEVSFMLTGNYSISDDAIFVLKEYNTEKTIIRAKSISKPIFNEASTEKDKNGTYFELIFDPSLPDNTRIYVAMENGKLINNDTGEVFTKLCEKNDWCFTTPELVKNVWGFRNYNTSTDTDPIDFSIYKMFYKPLTAYWKKDSGDKGLCSGFVGTLMDFNQGYITCKDFGSTFEHIEDIKTDSYCEKLGMTADEYIKLSYVIQFDSEFCKRLKVNRNKLSDLYRTVKNGKLVYIKVFNKGYLPVVDDLLHLQKDGHALMGYRTQDGYNTKDGHYSDIQVYDCNLYNLAQKIRLYGVYPNFTKWEYLNQAGKENKSYSKYDSISFDAEYPSAYLVAKYISESWRSDKNSTLEIGGHGRKLIATDLNDFKVIDSFENTVLKNQAYSLEQDILIPITAATLLDKRNDDINMYWVEPNTILEATNNENVPKKLSFSSDSQMVELDVSGGDTLSIATNNDNETMDIRLEHQNDSDVSISYSYIINEEIATIQVTGNSSGNVVINGKKDSADIDQLNINTVKVSYNEQELVKKLNLPSGVKVNVSIEQAIDDTYLKIMYDTDNDGYSDTDLVDPIPFNPVNENPQIVPVSSVDINIPAEKIMVGDKVQLTAIIQPDNATDKSVIWTSSDESTASISSDGIVTAIKSGTVNITLKSATTDSLKKTITLEIQNKSGGSSSGSGSSSGGGSSSGSGKSSGGRSRTKSNTQSTENGTITIDAQKGYINSLTGIITGTEEGYSRWQQDKNGWNFLYANGTFALGTNIIDAMGEVHEQVLWEQINGAWYAFGADGYAKFGFIYDYSLSGWFYVDINKGILIEWQFIDNNWYYFNPVSDGTKGKMLSDTWIGEYYLNSSGIWEISK